MHSKIRETKDTVRVSLQEYLFTGSSKSTSCGFWQKRVRLSDLLEGGLTVLQEPALTVLLVLPKRRVASGEKKLGGRFGYIFFFCSGGGGKGGGVRGGGWGEGGFN